MKRTKKLVDEFGVIRKGNKIVPDRLKHKLLEALAELEDNECHRTKTFPKTRLHRVVGVDKAIYRGDIDKISGWRIHVQYNKRDDSLILNDIIEGKKHDDVLKIIKTKKDKYY